MRLRRQDVYRHLADDKGARGLGRRPFGYGLDYFEMLAETQLLDPPVGRLLHPPRSRPAPLVWVPAAVVCRSFLTESAYSAEYMALLAQLMR